MPAPMFSSDSANGSAAKNEADRSKVTFDFLDAVRWHRFRFTLQNRRTISRRSMEHPLFAFHSILLEAREHSNTKDIDFLFHPVGKPFLQHVVEGHSYDLEVVFPIADADTVRRFSEAIPVRPPNFELISCSPVQKRSLACLQAEMTNVIDFSLDEICLNFITPLKFHPVDPKQPWLIDSATLTDLCTVHLARLYTNLPWPMGLDSSKVQTLSEFWFPALSEGSRLHHKSKSQGGHRQTLEGYVGPLYLRGEWQPFLPLLLICSELHTGYGIGDEHGLLAQRFARHTLARSAGAFRLHLQQIRSSNVMV